MVKLTPRTAAMLEYDFVRQLACSIHSCLCGADDRLASSALFDTAVLLEVPKGLQMPLDPRMEIGPKLRQEIGEARSRDAGGPIDGRRVRISAGGRIIRV